MPEAGSAPWSVALGGSEIDTAARAGHRESFRCRTFQPGGQSESHETLTVFSRHETHLFCVIS